MSMFFWRKEEPVTFIKVYFVPQPDITAHELADMLSRMILPVPLRYGFSMRKDIYDAMPSAHRRHFSLINPEAA